MTHAPSLAGRLFLAGGVLLLLALLVPWLYLDTTLRGEISREAEADAVRRLNLVLHQLQQKNDVAGQTLQDRLAKLAQVGEVRITWVDKKGRVLADSSVPFGDLDSLDNHAARPEVRDATPGQAGVSVRYSGTLGRDMIYAAKPLFPEDRESPVVRVAIPFSQVRDRLEQSEKGLALILGGIFVVLALLALLMARRFSRSVSLVAETARTIGDGNYNKRIREYPAKEFAGLVQAINTMAENISSQLNIIQKHNKQLQAILDGMWEGVMALDREGKIQAVNDSLLKIFPSATREHALGRTPVETTLNTELDLACREVLDHPEQFVHAPRTLHIQAGENRFHNVNIVPWGEEGHWGGAVVVCNDVSELKRLEKVRQDFLANITHELRTPLTSIKGYAEILVARLPGEDPSGNFAGVILKNADNITRMVENLLRLSSLEAHAHPLELEAIDISDILAQAWKECEPLAHNRNIVLNISHDASTDTLPKVLGDRDKLVQVFRNILENAVKYSPTEGRIEAAATVDEDWVDVTVEDQGPGIPHRDQERIFERFYRVEQHRTKDPNIAGTGLGLSISKHIVDMHHGDIRVESPPPGKSIGSIFHVRLKKTDTL
jgi:two-component system, OmpR family, phosphate regulon sensor histidine kinase PhoR